MVVFPAPYAGIAAADRQVLLRAAASAYLGRYRSQTRLHTEWDLHVSLRWCAALRGVRCRVGCVGVYARMVTGQKPRLVRALQAVGEVVTMTGDGVTDAPALRPTSASPWAAAAPTSPASPLPWSSPTTT